MPLRPVVLREPMMDTFKPSRILNQHFGNVLAGEDLLAPFALAPYSRHGFYRPLWPRNTTADEQEKFQVNLDVEQFKPEEITVKVTGGRRITIEGKHEEIQDDHGFIARHFIRRYDVPGGYDVGKIVSNLSSDGVLTITAPNVKSEHKEIPIIQTGKPAAEQAREERGEQ